MLHPFLLLLGRAAMDLCKCINCLMAFSELLFKKALFKKRFLRYNRNGFISVEAVFNLVLGTFRKWCDEAWRRL